MLAWLKPHPPFALLHRQQQHRTVSKGGLLTWLEQHEGIDTAAAAALAQRLVQSRLLVPVGESAPDDYTASFLDASRGVDVRYSIASMVPAPRRGDAMNTQAWWLGPARPATQVGSCLGDRCLRVDANGRLSLSVCPLSKAI